MYMSNYALTSTKANLSDAHALMARLCFQDEVHKQAKPEVLCVLLCQELGIGVPVSEEPPLGRPGDPSCPI